MNRLYESAEAKFYRVYSFNLNQMVRIYSN